MNESAFCYYKNVSGIMTRKKNRVVWLCPIRIRSPYFDFFPDVYAATPEDQFLRPEGLESDDPFIILHTRDKCNDS
jgi:hypothetical protein